MDHYKRMTEAYNEMEKVFNKFSLPYPVPDRYSEVLPDKIRPYIQNGPRIMNELRHDPIATRSFASAVSEHVSTKVNDQWENAKLAFENAPDSFTKGQLSYWLIKMAGSSKKKIQDLVDFCVHQEPQDLRDLLGFLATRINQEQWDALAPKMTVPDDQLMLKNFTARKSKTMEKNGVTPWFPPAGRDSSTVD